MIVPVNDLKRSVERNFAEYEEKVISILRSGWYVLGGEVDNFETEFSELIGSQFCVGVDNGLNAITLGLKALGVGVGCNVAVQSNTYIATVLGITNNGATPLFIEPNKYHNMDAKDLEKKITNETKAVLVTHLYGQATEMDEILDICYKKGIPVVEDCAQSHFAAWREKKTGTLGRMGFFSFYPTKNIGAFGDAGAIVTDDLSLANTLRKLRNYGSIVKYQNEIEGFNARLDEMQAGLLRVRLKHSKKLIEERAEIANKYIRSIKNPLVILPVVAPYASHVWHLFVVQVNDRESFRKHLSENGISSEVHYPTPPHLSKAYLRLGYKQGDFPICEQLAKRVVSLPIFNGMTENEIDYVIRVINEYRA